MSMFTRRHYVWLASALREVITETIQNGTFNPDDYEFARGILNEAIRNFATALEGESQGFDRTQFLAAIHATGAKQATCARCGTPITEKLPGIWIGPNFGTSCGFGSHRPADGNQPQ